MTKKEEPKELFDFSRVNQERIQEEDSLRSQGSTQTSESSTYSLTREPSTKNETISRITSRERTQIPPPTDGQKKVYFRKALRFFSVFVVAIPLTLLGGTWGFISLLGKMSYVNDSQAPKGEDSEVIQALSRSKERKQVQFVYSKLTIRTQPSPAMIYLNGKLISNHTPMQLTQLVPNTPLQIRITKPGFEDSVRFLNLDPNEERVLEVKLVRGR